MSSRAHKIIEEFNALPEEEKIEVLEAIVPTRLDELDSEYRGSMTAKHPDAFSEDESLMREIDARLERYDRGEAVLYTPEEVERNFKAKFQRA